MKSAFPKMSLGRALAPVSRPETVDSTMTYSILGAHWYAKGLYVKDVLPGSAIQAKRLYRVEQNDFVYNRLFGWKGSFAIATSENHGCYVSNEFPCFIVKPDIADGRYIWRYFSRPSVWDEVLTLSTGGTPTSRNRLKEEQLLRMEIPLPPIEEQRRIVVRIEQMAAKVAEARALRGQALAERDALMRSALNQIRFQMRTKTLPIAACSTMSTGTTPPSERSDYYGGPIQWFTPGDLGHRKELERSSRTLSDAAVTERKARIFSPGTVLLVAIGASLGKVGLTRKACSANQQITGIRFCEEILPDYGYWWLRGLSDDFMAAAPHATLPIINQERIGVFEIAIPPRSEQRQIVAHLDDLQEKADALEAVQNETCAELDALIPSILDKAFRGEL